jgi:hypothetical protein
MPLNIDPVKEKLGKCPYAVQTYCPISGKILETQMDKMANCINCKIFVPK